MIRFQRAHPFSTSLILAVLLLLNVAALACSSGSDDPSGIPDGQHLRLTGSAFGISTLDPALVRDVETAFLSRQVFRGLVRLDESLEPVLELAADYEVLDDGLRYRFTLRPDLTFHNGNPLDAQAVVSSFNRASDPALGTDLSAATYFSDIVGIDTRISGSSPSIEGVRALDDLTVEFVLHRPAANFLLKLTGSPAAIVDTTVAQGDTWWQQANGSGPFQVTHYEPGRRLELRSFSEYLDDGPRLEEVTVLFGSEASQPLNLYEAGSIDVAGLPGWAVDRVQSPGDPLHTHLRVVEEMSTTYLAFNTSIAPFDDSNVRRMIATGFDIDRMIELAYVSRTTRAYGLIPPGIADREWPSDVQPYDLSVARALQNESSANNSPPTIVEPGAGVSSIVRAVLGRDLGVEIVAIDQPWPDFAESLPQRELPAIVLTWVADYPDPENTLATLLRSGSPDNFIDYRNPAFDRLIDQAAVELDGDERAALYLEAQQIALDDTVVIPLYHGMSYTLVQPWVQGLTITEIGILALEDVWIESE